MKYKEGMGYRLISDMEPNLRPSSRPCSEAPLGSDWHLHFLLQVSVRPGDLEYRQTVPAGSSLPGQPCAGGCEYGDKRE